MGSVNATEAVNVKARLVIIKDANKFALAIAAAMKGSADAAATAVTKELTPSTAWSTDATAFITAQTAVDGKQRDYDAAVTAGDTAKSATLGDELRVAKAKLNEAAAALNRPLPYPDLLS